MSETKSPWRLWLLIGFVVGAMLWVSYARRLPGGAWGLESDSAFEGGKTLRFALGIEQAGREHGLAPSEGWAALRSRSPRRRARPGRARAAELRACRTARARCGRVGPAPAAP